MVDVPGVDEDMTQRVSPKKLVQNLALAKAAAVALRHKDAIVIAADTVAALGSRRWSKPESKKEASMILRALSGKTHDVWTGFAIIDTKTGARIVRAVKTRVTFRSLTSKEIQMYVATGEPMDGAGGYKMQGAGGFVIASIHGDYNNILGMPLPAVLVALKQFGVRV